MQLLVGAFFRWEEKEITDAETGKLITQYHGITFPWQACGPGTRFGSKRINFHVQHWVFYGLVRLEATGQTCAQISDS